MSYDAIRARYKPAHVKYLMIAESPPPNAETQSSRHFYRTDTIRRDDRLFVNTMRALYPEAIDRTEAQLEADKKLWLERFGHDGWYMIEALERSLPHEVTKAQRCDLIREHLDGLIDRVRALVGPGSKLILVKSNVFDEAAGPLRAAGFRVLNEELLDYPGRYNQQAYRQKLARLARVGA